MNKPSRSGCTLMPPPLFLVACTVLDTIYDGILEKTPTVPAFLRYGPVLYLLYLSLRIRYRAFKCSCFGSPSFTVPKAAVPLHAFVAATPPVPQPPVHSRAPACTTPAGIIPVTSRALNSAYWPRAHHCDPLRTQPRFLCARSHCISRHYTNIRVSSSSDPCRPDCAHNSSQLPQLRLPIVLLESWVCAFPAW